jgi:hypothetical protein
MTSAAGGYRLALMPAANVARPLARLRGVLVTADASGATRAVRVDAPVATRKTGGLRPPPKEEKR